MNLPGPAARHAALALELIGTEDARNGHHVTLDYRIVHRAAIRRESARCEATPTEVRSDGARSAPRDFTRPLTCCAPAKES